MQTSRDIAFDALRKVHDELAYSNLVVPKLLRRYQPDARDSGFITELVLGTLRHRGTYDAVIQALSNRDLRRLDPAVLDVLRLGLHQLLTMRVATHAAVTTSVDLTRSRIGHKPAGFVNAVLRRAAERTRESWIDELTSQMDRLHADEISYSHPAWIISELDRALDHDTEQLRELMARNNVAPPVTLIARPGLCDLDELPGEPGVISHYAKRMHSGDPGGIKAVRDGRAGVQDEGSQAVVLALAEARVDGAGTGERWLDVCAGPGGKAAFLGALAAQRGATLTANEIQPHRAELVRKTLSQLPDVVVTEHDGRDGPWAAGTFDRVLLDAPCTGLGALRRRPELRWRRTRRDLEDLVGLQRELLARAIELTRPGGVIAYATCSPLIAETDDIVDASSGASVDDVLRWWPHIHDTDAMYLAMLRRQ